MQISKNVVTGVIVAAALLLVVAAINKRFGPVESAPAFIQGEQDGDAPAGGSRPGPTILQARESETAISPRATDPGELPSGSPATYPTVIPLPIAPPPGGAEGERHPAATDAPPNSVPPLTPITIPPPPTSVTTQANDSFWSIAERTYGDGRYYRALYQHNRARVATPDAIPAGLTIATPPTAELERLYPAATAAHSRPAVVR